MVPSPPIAQSENMFFAPGSPVMSPATLRNNPGMGGGTPNINVEDTQTGQAVTLLLVCTGPICRPIRLYI